jgi:signal transduction histidine kinase
MTHTIPRMGRLLHDVANEFSVLYGTTELFAALPGLSDQQRRDVAVMLDALRNLAALLAAADTDASADTGAYQLTADLVHELKTPLQALLGFAEMLQVGEVREDCLRGVLAAGRHMTGLLDEAITVDAGERQASAGAAVAEAILLTAPLADAAKVRLVQAGLAADDVVRADPLRLRQVVLNLLTNAIGCSPRGSAVRTVVSRQADTVTVAFHDEGPGLTAGELVALLGRRRGEDARGRGLLITCDLVEDMDGFLSSRSAPGRGSCLSIDLPALAKSGS